MDSILTKEGVLSRINDNTAADESVTYTIECDGYSTPNNYTKIFTYSNGIGFDGTDLKRNDVIRITYSNGTSALSDDVIITVHSKDIQKGASTITNPCYDIKGIGFFGTDAYYVVISTNADMSVKCYKWMTYADISNIIADSGTGSASGTKPGTGTVAGGGDVVEPDPSTGSLLKP